MLKKTSNKKLLQNVAKCYVGIHTGRAFWETQAGSAQIMAPAILNASPAALSKITVCATERREFPASLFLRT